MVTMGQMFTNVFWIILSGLLYFLFFCLLPFWLRGCKFDKGNVFDNLVTSFMVSNFVVISIVYFLVFLRIYNTTTLIIGILLVAIAYLYWFRWRLTSDRTHGLIQGMILLSEGKYNGRVILNNVRTVFHDRVKMLMFKIVKHPVNIIVFLCGFGFAAYYRNYTAATQLHFATSDLYVHANWIKYLDNNIVYMNGVYPFGYHNMLSAFRKLTGMNLIYMLHIIGGIIGIFVVISMFFMCRRIFKSQTAANCAFIFYCMCDAIFTAAIIRQAVALPQEYAMIFIYPCGYFLHKYFVTKDIKQGIYFSIAFCLTLAIHFYATITAAFICAGIVAAHLGYLFQKKMFVRLVAVFFIVLFMTLLPFGVGKIMGIRWEPSMDWATSVIRGDTAFVKEDELGELSAEELEALQQQQQKEQERSIAEIILEDYVRQMTTDQWFYMFVISLVVGGVLGLIKLMFKSQREHGAFILGFVIYAFLLTFIIIGPVFKLPSLMIVARGTIFYAYAAPIILAMPIEVVHTILYRKNYVVRTLYFIAAALIGCSLGYYLIAENHVMALGSTLRFQYDSAVAAYYKIVGEHPKNTWTIVSPVEETCMVRGDGFHYELRDFMLEMYEVDEHSSITLPTKYVFIFIEKRPLKFNESFELTDQKQSYEKQPMVTLDEAKVDLYSFGEAARTNVLFFYKDMEPRRILQAKAYYWAKEYEKYFPHEMKVYYEDDEFLVYKITQNMYALNNFAIPYVGNSDSVSGE